MDKYKIPCPKCATLMDYESKQCIVCYRKERKDNAKGRSKESLSKIKEYKKGWYQTNKPRLDEKLKTKRDDFVRNREYFYTMKTRFGLTKDQILEMYDKTKGNCEICGIHFTKMTGRKNKLNIDHCHKTNKVRGLLCHNCNLGLGNFRDDILILIKAIKYLQIHETSNSSKNTFNN